jgi:hypothetical protein
MTSRDQCLPFALDEALSKWFPNLRCLPASDPNGISKWVWPLDYGFSGQLAGSVAGGFLASVKSPTAAFVILAHPLPSLVECGEVP